MEQPAQPPKPKAKFPLTGWLLMGCIAFFLAFIGVQQYNAAKPQLDLKNTGTTPVTVQHRGESSVVQPGQTWHSRFSVGDELKLHAGDAVAGPSQTVTLEPRGMEEGLWARLLVEVKVEGTNIVFEYSKGK